MTQAGFICPKCGTQKTVGLGDIIDECICGVKFTKILDVMGVHSFHSIPIFTVEGETEEYTTIPYAMHMGSGPETQELADRLSAAWKRTAEIEPRIGTPHVSG